MSRPQRRLSPHHTEDKQWKNKQQNKWQNWEIETNGEKNECIRKRVSNITSIISGKKIICGNADYTKLMHWQATFRYELKKETKETSPTTERYANK